MAPSFGTSGLRGLVTDLTPETVQAYTAAFIRVCPVGPHLFVGRDLRASSPRIAGDVVRAGLRAGVNVTDCGAVPTPALALAAQSAGAAAIMVTGSHIPADRNGLKFYVPGGEISKSDEAAIAAARDCAAAKGPGQGASMPGRMIAAPDAAAAYQARYVAAYGPQALAGMRLGIYQHSSVARDLLVGVVAALGATPVPLAPSARFVPMDTEAVDGEMQTQLQNWCAAHRLDAILSTDGDADRPMLTDATGRLVPGDVLGVLTAQALGADVVCTPISSNSMVGQIAGFRAVHLTRIGSPFVLAAMKAAQKGAAKVVGFEANGGFLLGFTAQAPMGPLAPLMTRDALLPMIAPLAAARAARGDLGRLVRDLPQRFTMAGRLAGVSGGAGAAFVARLGRDAAARAEFLAPMGVEGWVDRTDGLRIHLAGGDIVHLRPSGNAPDFRIYTEADSGAKAGAMLATALEQVRRAISGK